MALPPSFSDFVVEFFQAPLRPRHGHDMRAGLGERARGGIADAARGAGDEGDAVGEGKGHSKVLSSSLRTGIHAVLGFEDVDGRDKAGHDG